MYWIPLFLLYILFINWRVRRGGVTDREEVCKNVVFISIREFIFRRSLRVSRTLLRRRRETRMRKMMKNKRNPS